MSEGSNIIKGLALVALCATLGASIGAWLGDI